MLRDGRASDFDHAGRQPWPRFGAVNPTAPGFYQVTPSMGLSAGANLFQSFGTFNIGTGDTVDFTANAGTQNIIARVTGGSASSINGTIESGAPNFYLLNPAGVMFGANAQVNLTGAFTVSTANYARLSDGTVFYADTQHPVNDAGLTSAPISAFGFTAPTPAPVTFSGSLLENAGGIHVIAGDITLDGSVLYAPGGNVTLFSAASAGEVPFSLASPGTGFSSATTTSYGAITLQNGAAAGINSVQGGGSVVIRGGHLVMSGASTIASTNSGATAGGGISIQAVSLTLQSGSTIFSSSAGAGTSAAVSVRSGSVSIDGTSGAGNPSGIFAESIGAGNAGPLTIAATGAVSVTNGGQILSLTEHASGPISLTAGSLLIDGASTASHSSISALASGAGTSGAINIGVDGALVLSHGGEISANAPGGGEGPITITAGTFSAVGGGTAGVDSGIFAASSSAASGGTVDITVAGLASFTEGGNISVATFSSGEGGSVMLKAGSLVIDGSSATNDSGIYSGADGSASTGNGGTVQVDVTGAATLTNGGIISGSSEGMGDGGDITVNCGSLRIAGSDSFGFTSGVSSLSVSAGVGGTVTINSTGLVSLTAGGDISADCSGSGRGGAVNVNAGQLQLEGSSAGFDIESEISSNNTGSGQGGVVNVDVTGGMSVTNGAVVSADSNGAGDAGSVTVQAGSLNVSGCNAIGEDSSISSRAGGLGNSGVVVVDAAGGLNVTGGAEITAASYGTGNAGDVTVRAGQLSVAGLDSFKDKSAITSGAFGSGNGGMVNIVAGGVTLANLGWIAAFSNQADAGDVVMRAGNLTLTGGGQIDTGAAVNGGSISLKIADIVYLLDSSISASAGDTGGNITIGSQFVVLDNSSISAYGGVADGNINVDTSYFLDENSPVSATGFISISVPNLDLSNSLVPLPDVLVDDDKRLRETCARSVNHEFSSLVVVGRGGTELTPDELQPDFGMR